MHRFPSCFFFPLVFFLFRGMFMGDQLRLIHAARCRMASTIIIYEEYLDPKLPLIVYSADSTHRKHVLLIDHAGSYGFHPAT